MECSPLRLPSVEKCEAGLEVSKFCTPFGMWQVTALSRAAAKKMRRKGPERSRPLTKTNSRIAFDYTNRCE